MIVDFLDLFLSVSVVLGGTNSFYFYFLHSNVCLSSFKCAHILACDKSKMNYLQFFRLCYVSLEHILDSKTSLHGWLY